ncbi:MAG: hypothetical protein J6D54_07845 [Olsenella sp.]|nr:hypothetical protein [Olsenella sp.]
MSPSDETPLETTIGYEQLAIDLTATLAMREPDPYVKAAMDFALELAPTKEYVREVLAAEVCRTTQCEEFADVSELDEDNRFFMWNNHVNGSVDEVPSHVVIAERITKEGEDYRREDEPNPVEQLQDRSCDNTTISRTAG